MEDLESVKVYINNQNDWLFKTKLHEVVKLSGGLANYVYRLIFQDKTTAVLKYFPKFLAFDRTVEMSQNRYFVEKEVLNTLGNHDGLQHSRLRVPKLLYFDDSKYVLIMEDAGQHTKTLLEFLKADQPPLSNEIIDLLAKEVYQFLKFLRTKSGISLSTHKDPLENISGWNILRSYLIPLYISEAKRFNLETELKCHLDKANELLQQPSNDEGSFVFGDLWPNSILLDVENQKFWIIDWEMSKFETREFRDLEQLCANLWIMKQNSVLFNSELTERFIKRLQFEYFGNEDADYRKNCDENTKSMFILWLLSLLHEKHWGLKEINLDESDLVKKALVEIE